MSTNEEILAELTATLVATIRTYGVVKSIEAFRDAMELIADPFASESEDGFKAHTAATQLDAVTGEW